MKRSFLSPLMSGVFAALVALVFTTSAFAQDNIESKEYGVTLSKPSGWEQTTGNEKAVAVFTHSATQSQIEVVPTKLMTAEVADVFFDTFHKTLTESNFERVGDTREEKIGDVTGKRTEYKFTHSGVVLKVHVFGFVKDNTSWLVVGYMQEAEEKNILPTFTTTVESMKFN